jgi:hypothetical protein
MDEDVVEVKAVDADDPNADLIGFEIVVPVSDVRMSGNLPAGTWKVTKTPWSDSNYVEIVMGEGDSILTTVISAGLVRNRMHAEADAELIGHAQDAKDALDADS